MAAPMMLSLETAARFLAEPVMPTALLDQLSVLTGLMER